MLGKKTAMAVRAFAAIVVILIIGNFIFFAKPSKTIIGSGSLTGVYYVVANTICDIHQKNNKDCRAIETKGSVHNLEMLKSGKIKFAIVQSDTQYNAYKGLDQFTGKPFEKLRTVFSIYPESFTVVVSEKSGIKNFFDLVDANINTGTVGSGTRHTTNLFLSYMGADKKKLSQKDSSSYEEAQKKLCDGDLDGMTFVTGHPSKQIKNILLACKDSNLRILPVAGDEVDNFIEKNPFLQKSFIPAKAYLENNDIKTFGVSANLVTRSDVSEEEVYKDIDRIFSNLGVLRDTHDVLLFFDKTRAVDGAIPSPLHEGAKKYFIENGLL